MNESVSDIIFDEYGNCNYCTEFLDRIKENEFSNTTSINSDLILQNLLNNVKKSGIGKKYDCVIGLSGGVDSSYVLYKAVKYGLRPLAVHMDNGWNSELSQENIENLVKELNVDLYTHVIDWEEYRNLQQAFFESGVIDIELLYDNAMLAVNYKIANKFKIKYVLTGMNTSTEGMKMPRSWNWFKYDKLNIKDIASKHGIKKFKTFPSISTLEAVWFMIVSRIKFTHILDFMEYEKDKAIKILVEKVKYRPYPYKHYESVFTRFYQGYLLPKKFNVDKRLVHFSTLICTNQLKRVDALLQLNQPTYPNSKDLEADIQFFLKKMKWTQDDLDSYLKSPIKDHDDYKSEFGIYKNLLKIYKLIFKK